MNRVQALLVSFLVAIVCALVGGLVCLCEAQEQMSYMLLEGSTLTDECTICGRPPLIFPMRGTFSLSLRECNPLFTTYDVKEIQFLASNGFSSYEVTGEGMYEIGGEVAVVQRMQLKAQIDDRPGVELGCDYGPPPRVWPMVEIEVREPADPPNPLQVFYLKIIAAPVREIWFSTSVGFTSEVLKKTVSAGDLLSQAGRIVRSNSELTARLGIMPMVPDLGLDAVDIAAGGEVLFSCEDGIFSETLGPLQHGDLLSDRGRIAKTNQELTSAFIPEPIAPDVGLDAVQVTEGGEVFFSIEEELFSEALGVLLRPGDLLSDKGAIVRTNEKLLGNLQPVGVKGDVGLDAIHVWRSGEIWFSTETGFQSRHLGMISHGDLLSDSGYIVFGNLELLRRLSPLEDLANFGLDGLFLVTEDYSPIPPVHQVKMMAERGSGDVRIEWLGDGKVSQVERADEAGGPYLPVGVISPEMSYVDTAVVFLKNKCFYRIRLW